LQSVIDKTKQEMKKMLSFDMFDLSFVEDAIIFTKDQVTAPSMQSQIKITNPGNRQKV
jgi:hypothetical protein